MVHWTWSGAIGSRWCRVGYRWRWRIKGRMKGRCGWSLAQELRVDISERCTGRHTSTLHRCLPTRCSRARRGAHSCQPLSFEGRAATVFGSKVVGEGGGWLLGRQIQVVDDAGDLAILVDLKTVRHHGAVPIGNGGNEAGKRDRQGRGSSRTEGCSKRRGR
jgi:hypothetical protein